MAEGGIPHRSQRKLGGEEWEPVPWWSLKRTAERQKHRFLEYAEKPVTWTRVVSGSGVFGQSDDWLQQNNVAFWAICDGEELMLIQHVWFGWPDPPEWGLLSRPAGQSDAQWSHWGHFSEVPGNWVVPEEEV